MQTSKSDNGIASAETVAVAPERVSDDDAALVAHFHLALECAERDVESARYALRVLGGRLTAKYGLDAERDKIARDGTIVRAAPTTGAG